MDNAATPDDTDAGAQPGSAFAGSAQLYEVNRLIGGAAYLQGHAYREKLIGSFRNNYNAVAPEYGLDIPLLLRICIKAKRDQAGFDLIFLLAIALFLASQFMVESALLTVFSLALAAVTNVLCGAHMRTKARQFTKNNFDIAYIRDQYQEVTIPPDIAQAVPVPGQNLVVYRDFLPFIGAGYYDGGWSFDCALEAPPGALLKKPVIPFSAAELYAHLKQSLQALQVPDLELTDRLFISGSALKDDDRLFSDGYKRPVQIIDDVLLQRCAGMDHVRMRHYLCIHVADWGGELVTSYFVRVVLRAKSLYIEYSRLHLRPVAKNHRSVDRMPGATPDNALAAVLIDIGTSPFVALSALLHSGIGLFAILQRRLTPEWKQRKRLQQIRSEASYNYGTAGSVRESLSGQQWQHFFQRADDDRNRKLIERNLLDALANFLDAHGADSEDLRERRTTILNNGIVVNGGDVRAEAFAVGKGARASKATAKTERPA